MIKTVLGTEFLNQILRKYLVSGLTVYITDIESSILVSTDASRQGAKSNTAQYVLQNTEEHKNESRVNKTSPLPEYSTGEFSTEVSLGRHAPQDIKTERFNGGIVFYYSGIDTQKSFGIPVYHKNELYGSVIVHGRGNTICRQGELIQTSIESALEFAAYNNKFENGEDQINSIGSMLLEIKPDAEKLADLMYRNGMDPALMRTVICISLNNKAGNINIKEPGYQPDNKEISEKVIRQIKGSQHFNYQDIVYQYNEHTVAIIKSFISTPDLSGAYSDLDIICQDLEKKLDELGGFSFKIAYGNLYNNTGSLKKSLDEALDIIKMGQVLHPEKKLYFLEHVFFENIYRYLYPQITNKTIVPAVHKLRKKDNTISEEFITCIEAFVDNCMSFSETSRNHLVHRNTINTRLDKLKALTGLDPINSFKDAFVVKMLVTHIRQCNYKP